MAKNILVVLLVLGLLAAAAVVVSSVLVVRTVENAVRPVGDLSAGIGTQVAEILHPTPTILPDPVTIVHEVRSLARLETIHYTLEKVITAETGQGALGFLFGDRLLFIAHGSVIAGVDLEKLEPQDVRIDSQGAVYLWLPEPEIFVATLDNKLSYVYDRETGLLTRGDVTLEAAARKAAEDEIRKAALEDGILEQARVNAEAALERLLRAAGIEGINFVHEKASPTLAAP
jgi:hypothetical protein